MRIYRELRVQPEQAARRKIDELLQSAGWHVCNYKAANIHAARGAAIREFQVNSGHDDADYLLPPSGFSASRSAGPCAGRAQGVCTVAIRRHAARDAMHESIE